MTARARWMERPLNRSPHTGRAGEFCTDPARRNAEREATPCSLEQGGGLRPLRDGYRSAPIADPAERPTEVSPRVA